MIQLAGNLKRSVPTLARLILSVALLCLAAAAVNAAPPAGTVIGNQASATYSDGTQTYTVTSEKVVTIVQQVASLTLSANGAKNSAPGAQVAYPHTIVNTGNGSDTFNLSYANSSTFSLTSVAFYADANGDGIADNTTPITSTGPVAAGGAFSFVVVGNVPSNASAGTTNILTVTATSAFSGSVTASNTDTTTASNNAVLNVTKGIDVASGAAGATRTYTLTYTNSGNSTATSVILTDVIPSGMTYVGGSARWSGTGSTTLTDLDNADNQSGIVYDFGVTVSGRATATIASVPAGASGTLSFQITVNSGLAAGANSATANTARLTYTDGGGGTIGPANTNTVQFTVTRSVALTFADDTKASAPQGGTVTFTNALTNNGNSTDSFDITVGTSSFPAGTTFTFFRSDGVTPLLDSNGNGTPDSGPLAPGATYNIVVKAVLPPNATGGSFTMQAVATSFADSTVNDPAVNTLTAISSSSVDLTNNSAGVGAPGVGAGPGASAVVTNTVTPGQTTRFTLYVANGSSVPDLFNLQASTDASFGTQTLPAGWTVTFRDANGAVITNTGSLNTSTNVPVYADVTVPAGYAPGTVNVYFRAISPSSGAADRLWDAITVNTVRSLSVTPNNSGQIFPGGTVVYSHLVTNQGNVLEGDGSASSGALATADNISGFTSVLYWDKNNDGVLDAADPVITSLADLTGGSNGASTAAGLGVGETATVFVKVFAPTTALAGAVDTTTLTLTMSGTINSVSAPSPVSATENSTVVTGHVVLNKKQALDAACDGTADGSFTESSLTSGAVPGACIRYQITVSNLGVGPVSSVAINDATPSNTVYVSAGAAAVTVGSVTTVPANNAAGSVTATVGTLLPGESATLTFGVKINP